MRPLTKPPSYTIDSPARAKPRRKAIVDAPPRTSTRSRMWHNGALQHEALLCAWQHAP